MPEEAVHVNDTATTFTLVGVRCPPETGGASATSPAAATLGGCSFKMRLRDLDGNATSAPWSPESDIRTSRAVAAVPTGAARLEVHFASADPKWSQWEGSLAQQFQRFAASQMAVSERSIQMVERFGEGAYLILDLVPSELALQHMLHRLLSALLLGQLETSFF